MTKKTKVLHITFDMRIGGTEQVIVNLFKGCNSEQFDMSILCIESPLGPFADDLLASGVTITALSRQPGFDTSLISQIRQHIKQHKIDIVHCHQYTPYIYGIFAALMSPAKVIFTEHGRFYPDSGSWKRKLVNPLLNRFTHAVTAISKATKQALIEFENIPASSIEVLYNGIQGLAQSSDSLPALRTKLGIQDDEVCFGTVARLDPIKNQTLMIKSFDKALKNDLKAKLIIVGDGEEMPKLTALVSALQIEHAVIFTGYEAKPAPYIALFDIYLLSSLSEGTSMTLLEAMSLSKPCIVTNAGGNPEIIQNQVNGLVTPNDDMQAFSEAMLALGTDPEAQDRMGKASKVRFDKLFSNSSMCSRFEEIYQSLR